MSLFLLEEHIKMVPYAISIGSLYAILYARLTIYFEVGMGSKYQLNLRSLNSVGVKHILKYFRRMRDYMLVQKSEILIVTECTNTDL